MRSMRALSKSGSKSARRHHNLFKGGEPQYTPSCCSLILPCLLNIMQLEGRIEYPLQHADVEHVPCTYVAPHESLHGLDVQARIAVLEA